jgi:deoxyribodipyrimidine photolyase-related protein
MAERPARWLFADQLGPHFLDDPGQPVLLVESRAVFRRRRFHRATAHLVLSALRHRAAELAGRATFLQTDTYAQALEAYGRPVEVVHPTSRAALRFVRSRPEVVDVLPARGFATSMEDFARWVEGSGGRLLQERFYRDARTRLGVLMDGGDPVGGRWNLDADNRRPPPRGARALDIPRAYVPREDDVDAGVREDLDRWVRDGDVELVGNDGPRGFAATREEARRALRRFVQHRLPSFGPYEDAMLAGDPAMAHSRLSAPMNLGLLDPMECVRAAEQAYADGAAPLQSVEGYVRQLIGWRDYVWHLYWHLGPSYRGRDHLRARRRVPDWLWDLDAGAVEARCLATVLADLRREGWVHHIPRLMVLGSYALQRGLDPAELAEWFSLSFVDGYDWVMVPNVVGMSQHADGGVMATKPYTSGGAYIDRMSDFCGGCRYDPRVRVGEDACPFTAGYWDFLDRHRGRLAANLDDVRRQERRRGTAAP